VVLVNGWDKRTESTEEVGGLATEIGAGEMMDELEPVIKQVVLVDGRDKRI